MGTERIAGRTDSVDCIIKLCPKIDHTLTAFSQLSANSTSDSVVKGMNLLLVNRECAWIDVIPSEMSNRRYNLTGILPTRKDVAGCGWLFYFCICLLLLNTGREKQGWRMLREIRSCPGKRFWKWRWIKKHCPHHHYLNFCKRSI